MQNTQENIKLFGSLITASGIFCLAVALLLLINYWHIRQTKPLETEALKSLVQQFQADPESEALIKEIRSLDLLARKAFFTSDWQIKTGAFLLLFGAIAFATFLRIYHTLKARILEPLIEGVDSKVTRMLSQRWILITGGLLLGSALVASFLTTDYLKIYEETGIVVQPAPPVPEVKVAVVDAGKEEKNGYGLEVRGYDSVVALAVVIPAKAGTSAPKAETSLVIPAKARTSTQTANASSGTSTLKAETSLVIPAKAGTSAQTANASARTSTQTANASAGTSTLKAETSLVIPAKAGTSALKAETSLVIPAKAGTSAQTANASAGTSAQTANASAGTSAQTANASPGTSTPYSEFRSNHPSFRGPFGQGVSYHTGIPVDWDGPSGKNIKWKVTLTKKGYNSPVIWGDKLFIAGADNVSGEVYCFNRLDGKLLWQQETKDIPGSPAAAPKVTSDTGLSAPSVTTDGQHVYAIFATGDILALDMEGKRIWTKNLGVPDNHYGHSSSLICWKDKVIIQFDTNKSGRLLALNTLTGEISWDMPRKSKISWSSPMMAEIDGKLQIITTSSPTVAGYDFDSGALLWSVDCLSGEVGPSAAFADGLVYAANEYATLAAIKLGPTPVIVWQSDEYLPEAASPVVGDGLLFIATSYGMFVCYDAKTGKKQWEKEFGQGFYGSPMIAEGKVYVMERSGAMHIFKVNRTLTSLGDPVLGEKSVVTPAFADGAIYLKGEKSLFCISTNQ